MPYINPGRSPVVVSDEGAVLGGGDTADLDARTPRVKALIDAEALVKVEAPKTAAKADSVKED